MCSENFYICPLAGIIRKKGNCPTEVIFLRTKGRRIPIQYKIMLLTMGMVCLVLTMAGAMLLYNVYQQVQEEVGTKALHIGRVIAEVPTVKTAILSENPSQTIQPITELWRVSTGAAFIVVANMEQIRLSHPSLEKIGTRLTELYRDPVLQGQEYIYIGKGSLAPSLRANVPIYELNGTKQIGFVSVGFYLDDIYATLLAGAKSSLYVLAVALLCSIIGSVLVARNVKQAIHGLEPYEIATLLREKEATLDSIREGVLAVDVQGQIRLINNEARLIMGQKFQDACGQPIEHFLQQVQWATVINTGQAVYDTEQRMNDIIIVANIVPIVVEGEVVGAVITFRDRTEISRLAEEMTGIHGFVDIMRAQTHEFQNKLHVISGLIQLGSYEEAVDLIVDSYANNHDVFEKLRCSIKDTVTFGLVVGKMSRAKELGIDFAVSEHTLLTNLPNQLTCGDMVIILGNLIDNAFEAVAHEPHKQVRLSIDENASETRIVIENSGTGIDEKLGEKIFQRGISSKGENRGYGLALVAEKVQINKGIVTYHNVPTGGVVFEVVIFHDNKGEKDE